MIPYLVLAIATQILTHLGWQRRLDDTSDELAAGNSTTDVFATILSANTSIQTHPKLHLIEYAIVRRTPYICSSWNEPSEYVCAPPEAPVDCLTPSANSPLNNETSFCYPKIADYHVPRTTKMDHHRHSSRYKFARFFRHRNRQLVFGVAGSTQSRLRCHHLSGIMTTSTGQIASPHLLPLLMF